MKADDEANRAVARSRGFSDDRDARARALRGVVGPTVADEVRERGLGPQQPAMDATIERDLARQRRREAEMSDELFGRSDRGQK